MREPIAQRFYPENREELKKQVDELLQSDKKIKAKLAIVPHAGYDFSGSVIGETIASITTKPKQIIILGTNHRGINLYSTSNKAWKTPLGEIKTIQSDDSDVSEQDHANEHSIEVILPFLQEKFKDFEIKPILIGGLPIGRLHDIADNLIKDYPDALFIASSDFIHYGPNYNYTPIKGTLKEAEDWVKRREDEIIPSIENPDSQEFFTKTVEFPICGRAPISVLLRIAEKLELKGTLINSKLSSNVKKDKSFVSYHGFLFE